MEAELKRLNKRIKELEIENLQLKKEINEKIFYNALQKVEGHRYLYNIRKKTQIYKYNINLI